MRPFTPAEVTKYVLWIVLALTLTAILVWRLFLATGHRSIEPQRPTATSHLRLPDPPRALPLEAGNLITSLERAKGESNGGFPGSRRI
jgi:hypothetical protein